MPPILLLVLLDLAATWVITHKIDMTVWELEDFFLLMVVGQVMLMSLFAWVVVHGVRSGLRSVNLLSEEIRQRSIDDMQPLEVASVPAEMRTAGSAYERPAGLAWTPRSRPSAASSAMPRISCARLCAACGWSPNSCWRGRCPTTCAPAPSASRRSATA